MRKCDQIISNPSDGQRESDDGILVATGGWIPRLRTIFKRTLDKIGTHLPFTFMCSATFREHRPVSHSPCKITSRLGTVTTQIECLDRIPGTLNLGGACGPKFRVVFSEVIYCSGGSARGALPSTPQNSGARPRFSIVQIS